MDKWINLIGLAFDTVGFLMLYFYDAPDAELINDPNDEERVLLNKNPIDWRKKKRLGFKFVLIGCFFQVLSVCISLCLDHPQNQQNTQSIQQGCSKKGCK